MEIQEVCRLCGDEASYNIFNDELSLEAKGSVKIYIALNNFMFEKLYCPDDFSSFMCCSCCNNLCDSFTFMLSVRDAEQNLWQATAKSKNLNEHRSHKVPVQEIQVEIQESHELEDEDDDIEIKTEEVPDHQEEEVEYTEIFVEPEAKKTKLKEISSLPESITYTRFELEETFENGQPICTLKVLPTTVFSDQGAFVFDELLESHTDNIYKCKYCVKAFSNADHLRKHILSSHLCLWCLKTVENYKDLQEHSRNHNQMVCYLCNKSCGSSANFRQHLKKQHMIKNLPPTVAILPPDLRVMS